MKDFEKNVLDLSLHFLRREYPEELILEAAILARQLDRDTLLNKVEIETTPDKNNLYIISQLVGV